MTRSGFRLLMAATAIIAISGSVQARGKLTTKYQFYTVSGTSAASLHRNMTVPVGFFSSERSYANITIKPSFSGTFKPGKRCRITGFGINGNFTVRLPKLKSGIRLKPALNREFKSFVAYVRKHELTHRAIWTKCLRSAERRISRLKIKSCTKLDLTAAGIIKDEWAKCGVRNDRFDAAEQKRLRRLPLVKAAFKSARQPKRAAAKKRRTRTNFGVKRRAAMGKAAN